jgi:Rieske Fe-S protein
MNSPSFSRRKFVKTFALGTALSSVLGKPWRAAVLAETLPASLGSQTATFKIRVSDYPALSEPLGSVRLGVNPVWDDAEPFPNGNFWPFIINRGENDEFYVLDSECRHASCVVPTYDDFFGILCPCHGSTYAIDGSVIFGPATSPLRRYQFEFDGDDTLTIHIPGLGFGMRAAVVPTGAGSRLQLGFQTHPAVVYQLHFRANLHDPWEVIPFATSPDGPANETSFAAIGLPASLYVDRTAPTGFYAAAMLLSEV